MKKLLLEHWKQYPHMQIEDAVKLLYQSEFGGGHMIGDPSESLNRILEEWNEKKGEKETISGGKETADCESIGGGMYRIYLTALDNGLAAKTLNEMFIQTAGRKMGTREGLENKLAVLVECCKRGELPFEAEAVQAYLKEYRKQGYPAVHHSAVYRKVYRPAYRVVDCCYVRYYEVFRQIDRLVRRQGSRQLLVAIDGMCGAGKSTMAQVLQEIYRCNLFHMDDFFLQPHQRTEARLNEIGGNVDYERFQKEVLDHVRDPEGFTYQIYNCQKQQLAQRVAVSWNQLNLVEGSYSQHPYFGDVWNLKFFCQVSPEEQLKRIQKRNGAVMAHRFAEEWVPKENAYFSAFHIRENSIPAFGCEPSFENGGDWQ